jgi:hypothetical protein
MTPVVESTVARIQRDSESGLQSAQNGGSHEAFRVALRHPDQQSGGDTCPR